MSIFLDQMYNPQANAQQGNVGQQQVNQQPQLQPFSTPSAQPQTQQPVSIDADKYNAFLAWQQTQGNPQAQQVAPQSTTQVAQPQQYQVPNQQMQQVQQPQQQPLTDAQRYQQQLLQQQISQQQAVSQVTPTQYQEPNQSSVPTQQTNFTNSYDIALDGTGINADTINKAVEKAMESGTVDYSFMQGLDGTQVSKVQAVFNDVYQNAQREVQTMTAQVHNLAGGKEQWEAYKQAFQNLPEHHQYVVQGYAQRGETAKAVQYVMDTCKQTGVINSQMGVALQGGYNTSQPMTAEQFKQGVNDLEKKYGSGYLTHPVASQHYQALHQQRALSKSQGF